MSSSKKDHPKLNPNKPKKRSVKDLVIKKFDNGSSTGDYSSEFKNVSVDEDINARPQLRDTELETTILESKEEEPVIKEETESSSKPFDSMKDVTKHIDSETDSKTNPTLDDFMETRPKLKDEVEVLVEEEKSEDEPEESTEEIIKEEVKEESEKDSKEELKDDNEEKTKDENKSSSIRPIDSVKGVIKKLEPEHQPSKPTLNPSPNDLKHKDSVIKEVIKKTESEVKSASDNTIDSVKEVIKKLDSDSKPTLNPSPNDLPKTKQVEEEKPTKEEIEEEKREKEEKEKIRSEIAEYEDQDMPTELKFTSKLVNLRIGIMGHKIKIVDILIVLIGLFLIFCGGIASAGVAEKVIDNVVFGERSTVSFLLIIMGILFVSSVVGPVLIKKSAFKGFYEQLQSVDAEPKKDAISEKSDSKNEKEENKDKKDKKEESVKDESKDS